MIKAKVAARPKIQDVNPAHVGAPMPGLVNGVSAKVGDMLAKGDPILQLEAMKMQAAVVAERAVKLTAVHVKVGDSVETKDLVAEITQNQGNRTK